MTGLVSHERQNRIVKTYVKKPNAGTGKIGSGSFNLMAKPSYIFTPLATVGGNHEKTLKDRSEPLHNFKNTKHLPI
jgi:hypothetical protein